MLVKDIFSQYISGSSYQALATRLSWGDIPYHPGTTGWNKHMVKRILENWRYLGTDEYPAIINRDTFEKAAATQKAKTQHYIAPPAWVGALTGKVYCGHCGASMLRDTRKRYGRWYCTGDEHHSAHEVSDDALAGALTSALNFLIKNPHLVEIPPTELTIVSGETIRLDNEVRRCTGKRGCDENTAISSVCAAAAARYAICDDDSAAVLARGIRRGLEATIPSKMFDTTLSEQTIRMVHISQNSIARITLLTGQTIERKDFA